METLFTITPSTTITNKKEIYETTHNMNVLYEFHKFYNSADKSIIKYIGVIIDDNNQLKVAIDKSYAIMNFHTKKYKNVSKQLILDTFRRWYLNK